MTRAVFFLALLLAGISGCQSSYQPEGRALWQALRVAR